MSVQRPNLLIIMVDQMQAKLLGQGGQISPVALPNLQALAKRSNDMTATLPEVKNLAVLSDFHGKIQQMHAQLCIDIPWVKDAVRI